MIEINNKEIKRLKHLKNKILNDISRGAWVDTNEKNKLWDKYDKLEQQIKELEKGVIE